MTNRKHNRKSNQLRTIPIPNNLARQVYPVVENRVRPFLERYLSQQKYPASYMVPGAMSLVDLCRAVYLQGLYDGNLACEHSGHAILPSRK